MRCKFKLSWINGIRYYFYFLDSIILRNTFQIKVVSKPRNLFMAPNSFLFIIRPKYLSSYLLVAIDAKLSPVWNKMSKYMVRRSDFLTRAFIEAVKTDIRVSENLDHYQVFLNLEGVVLRWTRPVTIQSLNIEEKYRGMFNRKEIDIISQLHIGNQWLCVLPNLTKAK